MVLAIQGPIVACRPSNGDNLPRDNKDVEADRPRCHRSSGDERIAGWALSGHMRLAPHVSSQGPLRPDRSALRFSQPELRQIGGCSALRFSQPRAAEVDAMPFRKKGPSGLTERLDVRVAPGEKDQLRGIARAAGLGVSDLVRL